MSHKGMYVPNGWSLKRKKKKCVAYFQSLISRNRERKILLVRYKKIKHNKKVILCGLSWITSACDT